MRPVRALALLLALFLSATALAQERKRDHQLRDNRERVRQDMRGDGRQGARPDRPRHMTPQERAKLRQDVQEANKNLKR